MTTITILGVTLTNHFSISEHVTDIISKCVQSLYALKVLRCHGMGDDALMIIFRSVVLAKIQCDCTCMCRPHGGALRIRPTNNDLKHLCVAAFVSIFIAKTIQPWISLLPIWMTDCLLLFYLTISIQHVLRCILPDAILIRTVLGLGAMNLC